MRKFSGDGKDSLNVYKTAKDLCQKKGTGGVEHNPL